MNSFGECILGAFDLTLVWLAEIGTNVRCRLWNSVVVAIEPI